MSAVGVTPGRRRAHVDLRTGEGMLEREARRVQELPLEPELAGLAVGRVTGDREVDRRKVDADLMRAPRLERHREQRVPGKQLVDLEVRHRVARCVGVEGMPLPVAAVAADRCVDRPLPRAWTADDERAVLACQLARADELLQAPVRFG
jgi:hypothetical protein